MRGGGRAFNVRRRGLALWHADAWIGFGVNRCSHTGSVKFQMLLLLLKNFYASQVRLQCRRRREEVKFERAS